MLQFSDYKISEKSIGTLLAKGEILNSGLYQKLIERKFFINEADIKRNILFNWNKQKLLPYDNKETGWQKFSLIEFTWLKIISQLRNLGLSLEKLKSLKTQLFDIETDVYKALFLSKLKSFEGEIANRKNIIKLFEKKDIPEKMWKIVFDELQMSAFSILILQILIYNDNVCLVINEENECSFIALQDMENEKKKTNQESLNNLTNSSFIIINIRKILTEFFGNQKINYDNEYLLGFLNRKEKNIIELVRKGKVKEVKIKFKNNEIDIIECIKSENPEIAVNQIGRGFKNGDYKTITVKVADGKILHYETSDLIKLKN